MKKYIYVAFMLMAFCFSNNVFAQTTSSPQIQKYAYCELVGTPKLLSTKLIIQIDYGQDKGGVFSATDTRVRDEQTGKVKSFNSMVDALNYMGNDGWEFVESYITGDAQTGFVYHWLLKIKRNN
ncbi:MAG: hypothetical protein ACOYMD_12655 [Paludibacter sp.]